MTVFEYTQPEQHILFSMGALNGLPGELDDRDFSRVMLCTTPHLTQNGHTSRLQLFLGERLQVTYDQVQPGLPEAQVGEGAQLAEAHDIQAVIGMGGGSPLDMAKAVGQVASLPVIAVPTTYSGAEMTPRYQLTRPHPGGTQSKVTLATLPPALVIYDPVLTMNLPAELTAASGLDALAHSLEAITSGEGNPVATASALLGIRQIMRTLATCHQAPNDLDARTDMLAGAHLAGAAISTVAVGLYHGMCEVLSGTAGLPHAALPGVVLPAVVNYHSAKLANRVALAADALGLTPGEQTDEAITQAAAEHVRALADQLGQPTHLQATGLDEARLPELANALLKNSAAQQSAVPPATVEDAMQLLQAAW